MPSPSITSITLIIGETRATREYGMHIETPRPPINRETQVTRASAKASGAYQYTVYVIYTGNRIETREVESQLRSMSI